VIAYAVHETGRREVIGLDVGESETEAFWREFLRSLRSRGLSGVRLVVSDAHEGLKNAIGKVMGCRWQRCTVHFLRDMLGHVHKAQQQMVVAAIRQVFAAGSRQEASAILAEVTGKLAAPAPRVAGLLEQAEEDLLAFMACPRDHWTKLRSTNPLERVNREIARRSDVIGIYPNDAALIRLASMLLIEQNDEWLVGRCYLSQESIDQLYSEGRPVGPGGAGGRAWGAGRRRPASSGRERWPPSQREGGAHHHLRVEPTDDPDLHHITRLDSASAGRRRPPRGPAASPHGVLSPSSRAASRARARLGLVRAAPDRRAPAPAPACPDLPQSKRPDQDHGTKNRPTNATDEAPDADAENPTDQAQTVGAEDPRARARERPGHRLHPSLCAHCSRCPFDV